MSFCSLRDLRASAVRKQKAERVEFLEFPKFFREMSAEHLIARTREDVEYVRGILARI